MLKIFIQYLAVVHSGVVHVALCHVMRKKLLVVIGAFRQKNTQKNTEQTVVKCFAQGPELLATTPSQKHLGQTDNNFYNLYNKDRYFCFYLEKNNNIWNISKGALCSTEKFIFLTKLHSYSQYQIKVYECGMPHLY